MDDSETRHVGKAPSAVYADGAARGLWQDDPAQRAVLPVLDRIAREIAGGDEPAGWLSWARSMFQGREPVPGLSLYRGIGRGTTLLLVLLHDRVAGHLRYRLHSRRFRGRVQAELATLKSVQDPLEIVAKKFAEKPLLCLD